MNDEKIPAKTQWEIVIEAGLNAIPIPGTGSLATLYFGKKQEQRFLRLERFYLELKDAVASKLDQLTPLNEHDAASLAEIIESINEGVEADFTEQKRDYFKACFVSALRESNEGQSDKRCFFVATLRILTQQQLSIVASLYKAGSNDGYVYLPKDQEGAGVFNSALEGLRSYGLMDACLHGTLKPGISWGEITHYSLSSVGREFAEFCLADSEQQPESSPNV